MSGAGVTLSFTCMCLTASILAYIPSSILDTDRPVHLAVLTLVFSSLWLVLTKRLHSNHGPAQSHRGDYSAIPLEELSNHRPKIDESKYKPHGRSLGSVFLFFLALIATLVLSARVEVQRRILLASECTTRSVEVWLPLLVAIYDALRFQRREKLTAEDEDTLDSTAYNDLAQSLKISFFSSRWRYLLAALLLSFGCHLVTGLWLSSQSTHICPIVDLDRATVPRLQWIALVMDLFLGVSAIELALNSVTTSGSLSPPLSWTAIMTLAAVTWLFISRFVLSTQPENRPWLLMHDQPQGAITALIIKALFLSILCLSTLYSILYSGLLHVTMSLAALFTITPGACFMWSTRRPYPPISSTHLTWSFLTIYVSWVLYNRTRSLNTTQTAPTLKRFIVWCMLVIILYPGLMKSNTVHFHPIDLLMYDAQNKYQRYSAYASQSTNLASAVRIYQERYQDNPPPGFDIWYEFARNRSVLVMDEFNQIYNDLFLFRAVPPADLREQTWAMVSNPWNEISGITIRNGKAEVQENVLGTHRWMLEGVVHMIDSFGQHLPDMDLAFNMNDECRIAVTHDTFQRSQDLALSTVLRGVTTFSHDRAGGWKPIPAEPTTDTVFENWSFRNTFDEWASRTCHPNSRARKKASPIFTSQLCVECAADHSLGQFLSNWSIAANPCHQPDMANLHGFYVSPAAFKSTHQLRPVFSQSKVGGFNDILYPSAWNYIDKVIYQPSDTGSPDRPAFPDPPFNQKDNSLYWRGGTSEGVSGGLGAWRGMARQRMVHLSSNLTTSQHDTVTLLLPDSHHPERFTYTALPATTVMKLGMRTDAHFVTKIERCGGRDCEEEALEFGLAPPEDFQSHWKYKYLMDLDGAGFSGRFLPFLQSRSLPFKVAIFREWYDSRLIPWLHFVPIDLRLHGLWSTLAYFSGVHGVDHRGNALDWKGHGREAELIAEKGREWSQKVLRKEDMEVYLFRLLLEWGRLTDDKRDQLGFVPVK